jgi:phosphoribosylformylglycinamidine (FGAM) synthase-like amidotransferase family enzyme
MSSSTAPVVVIPTGFGINCEAETAHAFTLAGAAPQQLHLNDLAEEPALLARARILALAGGFSFSDHLGAGKAFANRLRRGLGEALQKFVADGGLVLGICNGFQTMVRLGLVPGSGVQQVGLAPNSHGCFYDGWVSLSVDPKSPCVYTRGISALEVPVRHGEGRLVCPEAVLGVIRRDHLAAVQYAGPDGAPTASFPHNPNGSVDAVAGLCDPTGRLFGLMPHPEAFLYPENHPSWRRRAGSKMGDGLQVFRNAVEFTRTDG